MTRSLLPSLAFDLVAVAQDTSDASDNDLDHAVKVSDDVLWRLDLAQSANRLCLQLHAFEDDRSKKHPMVVLIHGGVHSNHMTGGPANAATIVRELFAEGYIVVDYRGSTGYGDAYKTAIDYGGMIALFNVFFHPEAYACAYAGVPVSDLIERRKYLKSMVDTMAKSAGQAAAQDDEEYKRRSPVTHVAKLARPLLVHGNTSDTTVRIVEVKALVRGVAGRWTPVRTQDLRGRPRWPSLQSHRHRTGRGKATHS